ncbi:MAG: 50S ribosomal protein L11 methyltransferase [Nitratireductor sp.]
MTQTRLYFETTEVKAKELILLLEPEFEEDGYPVAIFETHLEKSLWTFSLYAPDEEIEPCKKRIQNILKANNFEATILEEALEDDGWIEKTLSELAPVRAGRFVVHGSHDKHIVKHNEFGLEINAGLAFGTGHHGTTAGCLKMIDQELKANNFRNALDLGAGTGVLGIAVAKAKRIPVLASDIDPVSTIVCDQNAKINGVKGFVKSITATGFNNPEFINYVPFDLIIANILARPLEGLALDLSLHLSRNATVILSGLLPHQKARILAAYRIQGLRLKKAHIQDGWLTLVLKNG